MTPLEPGGQTTTQRLSCSGWQVSSTTIAMCAIDCFNSSILEFNADITQRYHAPKLSNLRRLLVRELSYLRPNLLKPEHMNKS